jgi:beta-lactamase superfamily II metal-dependent hydrolase
MANAGIRIRSYNVGFGDCFLLTFPDGDVTRNMLIDFGNAPGQKNTAYPSIVRNIHEETDGHLDLVVMTHEHLDHMEGLYSQKKTFNKFDVDYVWMSLPSHPDYYDDYPDAQPLRRIRQLAAAFYERAIRDKLSLAPSFSTLLRNNLSNVDRVNYVRGLPTRANRVRYLRRGNSVRRKPFSTGVKVKILAPERDVSVYYGSRGHHLSAMSRRLAAAHGDAVVDPKDPWQFVKVPREESDPANLSDRDWRLLRSSIQNGLVESIRAIDRAANNTSLVFLMEVNGKRLLFTADAELESWDVIAKKCPDDMKPVDFLKVSHHGSHNGTPTSLLNKLLPKRRKNRATIMVSTQSKVYGTQTPVPDKDLMKSLKQRCRKLITTDGKSDLWFDAKL